MPRMTHLHKVTKDGVYLYLGANLRPAPQYRLDLTARTLDPSKADLTQERNLGGYCSGITNQGQIGACTGFTVRELSEACARLAGGSPPALSAGWVYEEERKLEGSWPQDVGANTDDGVDLAIKTGVPADSLHPYDAQAGTEYDSAQAEADAATHKYIASHMSIDPHDPLCLKLMWAALDAKMLIYVDTEWPEAWFNPLPNGAVPNDLSNIAGGHSIMAKALIPLGTAPGGGYVALPNHWSTGWNPQAAGFGHGLRAGDFLMPWSLFGVPSTPVIHIGVVAPVAVQPNPQPQPQPDPGPQPQPNPGPPPNPPAPPKGHFIPRGITLPFWQYVLGGGDVQAALDTGWGSFFRANGDA